MCYAAPPGSTPQTVQPIIRLESRPGEIFKERERDQRKSALTALYARLTGGSESVPCRMGNTPDSASDNLGFRCAANDGQNQGKKKHKTEL